MIRYIVRRILYGLLVLWGVASLVFFLFNILPGDPARMLMGQRSDVSSIEAVKKELGLDKPLYIQYFSFLNDLSPVSVYSQNKLESQNKLLQPYISVFSVSSNKLILKYPYLRTSYQSKRGVAEIIMEAFPKTFILALSSILIAIVIGIVLGIIAAVYKDSFYDRIMLIFSGLGMSVPSFFAAIIIAWLFAFVLADYTGLSMVGSLYSVDDYSGEVFLNLKNLILPAITLGIRPLAIIISLSRSSLLEVLSMDYIRTAKAKGLSNFSIIVKHGLRNALNPVITAVSGWFASLLAGAVFVEYVFDWKGLGVLIVDALEKYDLPLIMGCVLFISLMLIIINILVDISYALLDPRVKLS